MSFEAETLLRSIAKPLVRVCAALALLCLAGCAALRIDVDVYKGPLTNEPDIQLRQFALLAIAAKPVLAHVRNDIEFAYLRANGTTEDEATFHERMGHAYYSGPQPHIQSRLAQFLNGALLAYEDTGGRAVQEVLRGTEAARTWSAVLDQQEAVDLPLARDLMKAAAKLKAEAKLPVETVQARVVMAQALACFLWRAEGDKTAEGLTCPKVTENGNPYRRGAGDLQAPCNALVGSLPPKDDGARLVCPDDARSNTVYSFLRDESSAKRLSVLVFGKDDPRFVRRLTQLGQAFLEARVEMRTAFEASLDLLAEAQDPSQRRSSATLAQLLMQPMITACVLSPNKVFEAVVGVSREREVAQRLRDALKVNSAVGDWKPADFTRANVAVEAIARDAPHAMSRVLWAVHRTALAARAEDLADCAALSEAARPRAQKESARQFGAARGPELTKEFLSDLHTVLLIAGSYADSKGAAGFDRARLPTGLESRTRNVLHMLDEGDAQSPQGDAARRQLREALIAFAHRLLFVSNNLTESVLTSEISAGEARTCITAAALDGCSRAEYVGTKEVVNRLIPRFALLQTLGNSLVLHANDLRRRERQNEENLRQAQVERAAAQSAQFVTLQALIAGVQSDFDNEQLKLAAAAAASGKQEDLDAKAAQAKMLAAWQDLSKDVLAGADKGELRDVLAARRLMLGAAERALAVALVASPKDDSRVVALKEVRQRLLALPQSRTAVPALEVLRAAPDQREVFDAVIADLRQRKIQAEASGLIQVSVNLTRAIQAAYQARTSSIFLRPASEYLKDVYSASALADGGNGYQGNMLNDGLDRLKPSRWFGGDDEPRREAQQNIDKLHWQNINNVTLRGGGNTNYVLAKDDVGNWYVKAYEADPKAVIDSAQSLALFNYGKRIDVNLLRRLKLERELDKTDSETRRQEIRADLRANAADENIGLQRVRDQVVARYGDQLSAVAKRLETALGGLTAGVKAELDKSLDTLVTMAAVRDPEKAAAQAIVDKQATSLSNASAAIASALALAETVADRRVQIEDAVLAGLRACSSARSQWLSSLRADPAIDSTRRSTLADSAGTMAAAVVKEHGGSYKRSLVALEDGIKLVGQARQGN